MIKLLTSALLALLLLAPAGPALAGEDPAETVIEASNKLILSMDACQKAPGGVLSQKALGRLQAAVRKLEAAIEALVEFDAKGLGGDQPASLACKYETDMLYDDVVLAGENLLEGADPKDPQGYCAYVNETRPLIFKRAQEFAKCVDDL